VGALAEVAFQSLEEWSGIDARRESEILAADLAESTRVAKIRSLTDHGTWNLHPDVHVVFRHSHARFSF
jgi:hypothetical protein